MVTSYAGGGRTNVALAADASLRVFGDDYLTLKWAGTCRQHRPRGRRPRPAQPVQRQVAAADRSRAGVQLGAEPRRRRDYRPELGFTPRRDYTTANVAGNYFFFTDENRYFRRVYPGALAFQTFRNADGALESAQWAVWVEWDTKGGGGGWVEPKRFHEDVLTPFTIGGAVDIPAGAYDFEDLQLVYSMDAGLKARADINFRTGTYFDGNRTQVIVSSTWNVSRHLELGGDYQLTALRFPVRDQSVDIQLPRSAHPRRARRQGLRQRLHPVQLDHPPARSQPPAALQLRRGHRPVAGLQRGAGHRPGARAGLRAGREPALAGARVPPQVHPHLRLLSRRDGARPPPVRPSCRGSAAASSARSASRGRSRGPRGRPGWGCPWRPAPGPSATTRPAPPSAPRRWASG